MDGASEPEYESEDKNDKNVFYSIFYYCPSNGYMI